MSPAPTLHDVAKACGVSIFTVSRVLNNKGGRTARTVARAGRIRAIAERMGYRPNLAARTMKGQRTRLIGLVIRDPATGVLSHPQAQDYMHGVDNAVREAGCATVLVDPTREDALVLRERVVDGAILVSQIGSAWMDRIRGAFPVHLWLDGLAPDGAPALLRDERGGVEALMDLLAAESRPRRFVYLTPEPLGAHYSEGERLEGVQARASRLSAPLTVELMPKGAKTAEWVDACLSKHGRGTCFIGYNILISECLAMAALGRGWAVPRVIGLASCDHHNHTDATWPRLTHVKHRADRAGFEAARLLLAAIDGTPPAQSITRYPLGLKAGDSHRITMEPA